MKGTKELIKAEPARAISPVNEMERWFEEARERPFSLLRSPYWTGMRTSEKGEILPSVDIYEEGNEFIVKADLPGVSKNDVKVDISGNMLTISGEKRSEEKVEGKDYYRYERSHGKVFRSFELPDDLDTNKTKAHYENGVLEIRIPKSAEAKKKSKAIPID